jgi:hypothetical protein
MLDKKERRKQAKKVEAKHEDAKIEDGYTAIVEVGKFKDEQDGNMIQAHQHLPLSENIA